MTEIDTELLCQTAELNELSNSRFHVDNTALSAYLGPEFKLELDDGDNFRTYILCGKHYDIGRSPKSSIYLHNAYISNNHATLERVVSEDTECGYTYQLSDGIANGTSSTNGIFVNGERISSCSLKSGDKIRFGSGIQARFTELLNWEMGDFKILDPVSEIREVSSIAGFSILDPCITIDLEGKIVDANISAEKLLGFCTAETLELYLADVIFQSPWKAQFEKIISRFSLTLDKSILGRWNNIKIRSECNEDYFADITISSVSVCSKHLLLISVRNVTNNRIVKSQLLNKIYQDSLTGLGNRRYFLKKLDNSIRMYREGNSENFAVLFIDLDRFKVVNDSLGHNVGDKLLIQVACRLRECLRETDVIARQGGDEFTVLLEGNNTTTSIINIVTRLSEYLNNSYDVNGHELVVTASIGVLLSSYHYCSTDEMLRDADFAMYRAKASGRGEFIVFDERIGMEASEELKLDKDL